MSANIKVRAQGLLGILSAITAIPILAMFGFAMIAAIMLAIFSPLIVIVWLIIESIKAAT